jgi:hypothetical protein
MIYSDGQRVEGDWEDGDLVESKVKYLTQQDFLFV